MTRFKNKYLYVDMANREREIITRRPINTQKLQHLVGGFIEFITEGELTYALNKEARSSRMFQNGKYQQFYGPVVVGRLAHGKEGKEFIGFELIKIERKKKVKE